ncbi:hypothetical protein L1887_13636 [Cichorium endivia]|nr:hypothetical protein L1887_13636 [Cichorium endivia]
MLFWYRNEDGEFGSSSEIQITVQVSENTSQSSYSSTSPIFVFLRLDLCDQEDCDDFPSSPPVIHRKAEIETVYGVCGLRFRRRAIH